jgi:hypothetical protein
MTEKYDFVVTSGGIGPTHDGAAASIIRHLLMPSTDITYSSLGAAFNLPLSHHPETMKRMFELSTPSRQAELAAAKPAEKEARERMALFPTAKGEHEGDGQGGPRSEVIFVDGEKWVPVVRLGGKVGFLVSHMRGIHHS